MKYTLEQIFRYFMHVKSGCVRKVRRMFQNNFVILYFQIGKKIIYIIENKLKQTWSFHPH
jgi:hypothetical protein